MADAEQHDEDARSRYRKSKIEEKKEVDEVGKRESPTHSARFIKDLHKGLYNSGEESVEDRLKKYRHYRQKGNVEDHAFLTRD